MTIAYKPLGQTSLQVAPLCFGCNVFGWTTDEKTSFALLDELLERGFNFIDTADIYSNWVPGNQGGESETIIGNWLHSRKKRDSIVLATKVGKDMGRGKVNLSAKYIATAVNASLKRLQTDYIDLYFAHADDFDTPLEETLQAFDDLVKAGKVRSLGASNYTKERLRIALETSIHSGLSRYDVLQPEYNLYDRTNFEEHLQPLALQENLAVTPYYALASGFLSGKYRSLADANKSPRGENILQKYLNKRGLSILNKLDALAKRYHATPAQIALAWIMQQPSIATPIVSASNIEQLKDILVAAELKLNNDAIQELTLSSQT